MRREHQVGPLAADGRHHLVDGRGRERGLPPLALAARLEHVRRRRDVAHLEDLGPAVAEPAVADHQAALVLGELARHRLHAEAAAARHDDGGARVVDLLQGGRHVAHHGLEPLRHVVQGPVGVHDRVLEQAVGIDIGQQGWHGISARVDHGPEGRVCSDLRPRGNRGAHLQPRSSSHGGRRPSVHHQHLPGDVGGGVAGEEQGRAGDLVGLGVAPEGGARDEVLP